MRWPGSLLPREDKAVFGTVSAPRQHFRQPPWRLVRLSGLKGRAEPAHPLGVELARQRKDAICVVSIPAPLSPVRVCCSRRCAAVRGHESFKRDSRWQLSEGRARRFSPRVLDYRQKASARCRRVFRLAPAGKIRAAVRRNVLAHRDRVCPRQRAQGKSVTGTHHRIAPPLHLDCLWHDRASAPLSLCPRRSDRTSDR